MCFSERAIQNEWCWANLLRNTESWRSKRIKPVISAQKIVRVSSKPMLRQTLRCHSHHVSWTLSLIFLQALVWKSENKRSHRVWLRPLRVAVCLITLLHFYCGLTTWSGDETWTREQLKNTVMENIRRLDNLKKEWYQSTIQGFINSFGWLHVYVNLFLRGCRVFSGSAKDQPLLE